MNRRVVVTGIGIWSCIGKNVSDVEQSLRLGRSGIGLSGERTAYGYHSALVGKVERPVLKGLLDRRARVAMPEQAEYAYMASLEALQMSRVSAGEVGCIFGSDSSAKPLIDAHEVMRETHDSEMLGAGSVFQTMNSTVTMNLCSIFGLGGLSFSVSAACASSSHAIGVSTALIRQGMQDMILCGGAQEVNKYAMSSFDALGVFATLREGEKPETASRPFDADRTGLVPSGGAAALVLEEYEHARRRGAVILAEIAGYGFSTGTGGRLSSPDIAGVSVAMSRALADAGMTPGQIDYINAHATATPQGDAVESQAITDIYGREGRPWVSSTKSMTGHECWMAGASEAVYSILMMRKGFVAPNINFATPDEYSRLLRVVTKTTETDVHSVMSNSFGFGGTNSSLILRSVE